MIANGHGVSFGGDELFQNGLCLWLHISVNTLKVTELYTLKEGIIWYVNYTSTNPFFKMLSHHMKLLFGINELGAKNRAWHMVSIQYKSGVLMF